MKINIGRIKPGEKHSQLKIDNPSPYKNGKVNDFHRGILILYHADTASYHHIKNMTISPREEQYGYTNNVWMELGNKFYCEKLDED